MLYVCLKRINLELPYGILELLTYLGTVLHLVQPTYLVILWRDLSQYETTTPYTLYTVYRVYIKESSDFS